MVKNNFDKRCKKAVLKLEDLVREINLKLSHIIENQKDERYATCKIYQIPSYLQPEEENDE